MPIVSDLCSSTKGFTVRVIVWTLYASKVSFSWAAPPFTVSIVQVIVSQSNSTFLEMEE